MKKEGGKGQSHSVEDPAWNDPASWREVAFRIFLPDPVVSPLPPSQSLMGKLET